MSRHGAGLRVEREPTSAVLALQALQRTRRQHGGRSARWAETPFVHRAADGHVEGALGVRTHRLGHLEHLQRRRRNRQRPVERLPVQARNLGVGIVVGHAGDHLAQRLGHCGLRRRQRRGGQRRPGDLHGVGRTHRHAVESLRAAGWQGEETPALAATGGQQRE
jgi:hypothetical protein